MKAQLLKVLYLFFTFGTFITTAKAQRYTSDTYGYACYNYFDNTNVTNTVAGTTTSTTSSAYSFSPDPTVAANNTSVVYSTAANLSVTTSSGGGLQSKYQLAPKAIAINNIASGDAATYAPLNSNDWEWSFLYKSNLTGTTYPTSPTQNLPVITGTNSWRYWLHSTTATISSTTKGFYITQNSDGCLYVYVQNGSGTTAQLLKYSTPLTNGVTYCIKVQRLAGAYWNLYVDQYSTSVPQAQTLRAQTNSDNQSISLTYSNSVIEAENASGKDGLFQFDEMHMYTRYCQFTGITSTANGITPVPLYANEGTVILYGEQIQMRGNYSLGGQIYFGKSDSGYPEGNIGAATLYLTPNSYFSTASPAVVSTSSFNIYSTAAQSANIADNFVCSGNTDGTLTTTGYYFITTTVNSSISQPGSSMTFNGSMTVYDNAKNNSPITCTSIAPANPVTITFGSLFDWKGGTATSGSYLWATGSNWVGGVAPSGSTDIARFGIYSTSYPYNQQPTLKANVSIGQIIVGTNITTSSGASTGGTATFNLTSGTAGTMLTLNSGISVNAGASAVMNGFSSASRGVVNFASGSTSSIASKGMLSGTNSTITNLGNFTLFSDATGTATIGQLVNSTFGGNISVQRFITGGSSSYRGYRLFSSPVNVNTLTNVSSTVGYYGLNYLNASSGTNAVLLAGPGYGCGFNVYNPNPLIYLYDESLTSSNASYVAGKNIGITAITGASGSPAYSVTTLSGTTYTSGKKIPVGNSFLLYYVGSASSYTITSGRVPDNTTVTTTGYINQGSVPVTFWNTNSTQIPYHTGNGGKLPGLNQVGNPYPSTISLDQVAVDNPAISPQFWELNEPGGTYISYNTSGATSNSRASKYIVSGQGFVIQALGTGETITFQEDQKVTYPTGFTTSSTPGSLLLSIPPSTSISNADNASARSYSSMMPAETPSMLSGLHLQITKDSVINTQTGIYFNTKSSDAYNPLEDAVDLDGTNPKVYLSSYSTDGSRLSINQLGDYAKGKRVKLFASAVASGQYNISLADVANVDTNNYNIFLVDKKMNDSLDMARYHSYAFNIDVTDTTSYGANRFLLAVEHKAVPPYALLQFSGEKVTAGVSLFWQTLNAGNYTGFVLQKLDANGIYNSLYTANSGNNSNYIYVDQHPAIGNNVYRLQQTDLNGNITYSAPVTILYSATSPNGNLTVYPNPAKSIITVNLTTNVAVNSADIYNTSGTLIKHESLSSNTFNEDVSSYKLGIYIIELKTQNGDLAGQAKFVKVN